MIQRNSKSLPVVQTLAMVLCTVALISGQALDSKQLGLTSKHYWHAGELKVSVKRTDVTSRRLLTSARALQDRTKANGVHFFLDPRAAEAFRFMEPEPHPGDIEAGRQYFAGYSRAGRETLAIALFGFGGPENTITLEGNPPVVRCRYEVGGRCLLRLTPLSADLTELSGTVTLTAIVTPKGAISDARVIEVDAQGEPQRSRLRDLVQRNLPFWWMDPGDRSIAVRIVYFVGPPATDRASSIGADLDVEYPGPLTAPDLDRLGPAGRGLVSAEHRKLHFRVSASVVAR